MKRRRDDKTTAFDDEAVLLRFNRICEEILADLSNQKGKQNPSNISGSLVRSKGDEGE